jgi:hypothetical protein
MVVQLCVGKYATYDGLVNALEPMVYSNINILS